MQELAALHLLRPWWLLACLPAVLLILLLWQRKSSGANWRRAIAPALLEHLLDSQVERAQRWPWLLLLLGWVLASFAMAGPTWEKLPQPVLQQRDGLVIALDLSLSMYAEDIKPSRLLRARYKVLDVLDQRKEGLTGLVAYSGDAHVVAPLTDDAATVANLVPALSPAMMPEYGSNPVAAVQSALDLLHNAGFTRGRILLISDEIADADIEPLTRLIRDGNWQLSILGVGTQAGAPIPLPVAQPNSLMKQRDGSIAVAQLHRERFETLASNVRGRYCDVRLDDGDLKALLPEVTHSDDSTRTVQREFDQWRERGPQLLLLLLPLAALAFRRGWLLALVLLPLSSPSDALEWQDLWRRPDQQGQQALSAGDAKTAAQKFTDPNWRGAALYRAGDYKGAAQNFSAQGDAANQYNRGNALAHAGQLQEALSAYDAALAKDPTLSDAKANRELVAKLLKQQQSKQGQSKQDQSKQDPSKQGQADQSQANQGQGKPNDSDQSKPSDSQAGSGQSQQNQQGQSGQQQPNPAGQSGQGQDQANTTKPAQQSQGASNKSASVQNQSTPKPGDKTHDQSASKQGNTAQNAGTKPGQESQQAMQDPAGGKAEQALKPNNSNPTGAVGTQADAAKQREEHATEQWLRQIPDDPSGLLRRKFDYEHKQRARDGSPPGNEQQPW